MADDQAADLTTGLADLFPALLLPEEEGLPTLAWLRDELEGELGLYLPPVPTAHVPRVRALAPGLVTTRADDRGPYLLAPFLVELRAGWPEPYLVLGMTGHGVDSWAMHYYLVGARLALFVQLRFGGAYGDSDQARVRVAAFLGMAETLVLSPRLDAMAPGQRLVVVASDLAGSRWGVIEGQVDMSKLTPADDVLGAAIDLLEQGEVVPAANPSDERNWQIWG